MDRRMFFLAFLLPLLTAESVASAGQIQQCQSRYLSRVTAGNRSADHPIPMASPFVIAESDTRYDDLRRHPNNLRLVADAASIVLPKTTDEVLLALQRAMDAGQRPTIRSGGHCYEDFWTNNTGGVLIDMSVMNGIYQLPGDDRTVWIEPGVKLEQMYTTLYKEYGTVVPAGTCLDLGMGGHVAGAGYGYLTRKFGLTIDYVHSMEVVHVDADRKVQTVVVGINSTDQRDRDLFWALRGGGTQNFGIITKFGFRDLPRSPPLIRSYKLVWPLDSIAMNREAFSDFMDKYVKFFAGHSSSDDEYCDMITDVVVSRQHNESYVSLQIMIVGDRPELADGFFQGVGLNGSRLMNKLECEEMSYYKFIGVIGIRNDLTTGGQYYTHKSAYMVGPMPPNQREAIWKYSTDAAFDYMIDGSLQIRSYGCALRRFEDNETAYAHRKAIIKIQYSSNWNRPEEADQHYAWIRDYYRAMYGDRGPQADRTMDGCFFNYPDKDLVDWQHLYFKGNYEKLMDVKGQWDPLNVFRHRQSVELPSNL